MLIWSWETTTAGWFAIEKLLQLYGDQTLWILEILCFRFSSVKGQEKQTLPELEITGFGLLLPWIFWKFPIMLYLAVKHVPSCRQSRVRSQEVVAHTEDFTGLENLGPWVSTDGCDVYSDSVFCYYFSRVINYHSLFSWVLLHFCRAIALNCCVLASARACAPTWGLVSISVTEIYLNYYKVFEDGRCHSLLPYFQGWYYSWTICFKFWKLGGQGGRVVNWGIDVHPFPLPKLHGKCESYWNSSY